MSKFRGYVEETYNELVHKVSWPTWKELQSSSVVVLVTSVIIALIIFLMDYVFGINAEDSIWRGFLGWFYSLF